MTLRLEIVEPLPPATNYAQNIFRFQADGDALILRLALQVPGKMDERKVASQKQRSTISGFFFENDVLPPDCGWQQASVLMNIRALSYAVSETIDVGFLAANRIALAPLIAAHISQSSYLRAVARGWSLGTWHDNRTQDHASWLSLISSPFYKELFDFATVAHDDFVKNAVDLLPSTEMLED